jgi:hypothetical protein
MVQGALFLGFFALEHFYHVFTFAKGKQEFLYGISLVVFVIFVIELDIITGRESFLSPLKIRLRHGGGFISIPPEKDSVCALGGGFLLIPPEKGSCESRFSDFV